MAGTPVVVGRRYLPFLAVAAALLLLVVIAPSHAPGKGSSQGVSANNGNGDQGTGSGVQGAGPNAVNGGGVNGAVDHHMEDPTSGSAPAPWLSQIGVKNTLRISNESA